MSRLSFDTLGQARRDSRVTLTPADAHQRSVGVIHLGIGAFHRAHQAVFTEDVALATGEACWGIAGVTQRSASVRDQLAPQDGLYGVLQRSPGGTSLRVVGSVREVVYPQEQQARLDTLFDDPAVTVVTLTVTEKGYRRDGAGHLDLTDPAVANDLAGDPPSAAVGRLVRGLQRRSRGCGAPVNVVTCDNLTANGRVLRTLVDEFCAALPSAEGDPLHDWIAANATFPSTMVDRIVPATTDADRDTAAELLGLTDAGLVVAEPFSQWVIEDDFAAPRPAWERVGAQLTTDVAPYELMKLRILNGSHSTLAYAGALAGYETIAEAVADPELLSMAQHLITDDVIPGLTPPDGADLTAYGATVLDRYRNPALAHRTTQIAMDGSQKLPLRLLGTIRDAQATGRQAHAAARGVAAWMAYVASPLDRLGRPLPLDDPLAERLGQTARGQEDAGRVVDGLLAVESIFGSDLPALEWFRADLVSGVDDLLVREPHGRAATPAAGR